MALDRTWYNTLVDDSGGGTDGTIWDKAAVDALMDAIDASLASFAGLTLSADLAFSSNLLIRRTTSDASDNGSLEINGGGATGATRGGRIVVYGNEHATQPGQIRLSVGNVTGSAIALCRANGNDALTFDGATGNVTFISTTYVLTNDGNGLYPDDNVVSCGRSGKRWTAVWATNGTVQTSDRRLKKDIEASDLGLDFIDALRPVRYRWAKKDNGLHYGLIAQDVKDLAAAAGANFVIDGDMLGMNYAEYIAPMIKAIQELSARVGALEKGNHGHQ